MEAGKARPGFYGWWLLFFLWVVYTIPVGFVFYGPPVLYPFMIEETGWSRGDIMVGYAAIMLLTGVASPLAAWMIGRLGVRVTLFVGGIGVAAINFAMALIGDSYPAYITLCVLLGLVAAPATFIPIQTVIVFWFDARRALALGLVLGGGAVGGFFAPQIVNAAVLGAGGDWRIGWTITGVAALVGAVVAILAVRNRPSDLGQHPDGLAPDAGQGDDPSGEGSSDLPHDGRVDPRRCLENAGALASPRRRDRHLLPLAGPRHPRAPASAGQGLRARHCGLLLQPGDWTEHRRSLLRRRAG